MEPHYGKPEGTISSTGYPYFTDWDVDIESICSRAFMYAEDHHEESLEEFRSVSLDELTPHKFWSEYIWTVLASGFSPKVFTKNWGSIMNAVGPWDHTMPFPMMWRRLKPIFGNERKAKAIDKCRALMRSLGWDNFRQTYCVSPDTFRQLPFIGSITCYHIARNCGIDAVKEDLHLVRLARHFEFDSGTSMCHYLSGLSGERVGVVDFVLWAYCAAFGTKQIDS